ncbi:Mpo1-like protein [Vibrio sp. SCSIO 43136]|uniref:Mpo1 family 2-hydroxy fatty acid dioxygenase n=1 Tax=Vibrio sp. SCSIO 43136 TaxID=2819101 RepID=UPI002074C990|nr:Mpo1-like protein [Vibrio sp. SCSIO 43136]USD67780.1 DUF962 domain-containing protein [Vibrio sp. SCSIO 43136]
MRTLEDWLAAYAESHQNKTNVMIHKVAVPGIYLSIVGLLWCLPQLNVFETTINWVYIVLAFALAFYARLSIPIMLIMAAFSLVCIGLVAIVESNGKPLLEYSIGLFVVLWIMQFVGHKIEGKKPSFFDDIQFLLIGPIWVFKSYRARKLA